MASANNACEILNTALHIDYLSSSGSFENMTSLSSAMGKAACYLYNSLQAYQTQHFVPLGLDEARSTYKRDCYIGQVVSSVSGRIY